MIITILKMKNYICTVCAGAGKIGPYRKSRVINSYINEFGNKVIETEVIITDEVECSHCLGKRYISFIDTNNFIASIKNLNTLFIPGIQRYVTNLKTKI
jgi:hypothetical protein